MIKLHDELTTGQYPIYNGTVALHYYELGKYSARQLEIYKHENIRFHLNLHHKRRYRLFEFIQAFDEGSGYCFETSLRKCVCKKCRITKTIGIPCIELDEYGDVLRANSFKAFAFAHEKWCKKVKNHIWKKHWEEYTIVPYKGQIQLSYDDDDDYDDNCDENHSIPF